MSNTKHNMSPFFREQESRQYPSKVAVGEFTARIAGWLYPTIDGGRSHKYNEKKLRRLLEMLVAPMQSRMSATTKQVVISFFEDLSAVKHSLDLDALTIANNDPAASNMEEVVLAYPGFFAILVYRLAHRLFLSGVPLLPRMMTEYAHSHTGIDIHPGATIGNSFFIDHGTGIVIGETAIVGNNVKLYQGVTIGALNVAKALAAVKRHPTIEDNVVIYAGSTILGGNTIVGHDSIIGGNVWLTESVQPFSMVYHKSEVRIRQRAESPEQQLVLDYSI